MSKPTRYPWHIAPDFAAYAATDADGGRWWHEVMPVIDGPHWWSDGVIKSASSRTHKTPDINWRDSLEERPATPERVVTVPVKTAEYAAEYMRQTIAMYARWHTEIDQSAPLAQLAVLDAAIGEPVPPIDGIRTTATYRAFITEFGIPCAGGPWDGILAPRLNGETCFPVTNLATGQKTGSYHLLAAIDSGHRQWAWVVE